MVLSLQISRYEKTTSGVHIHLIPKTLHSHWSTDQINGSFKMFYCEQAPWGKFYLPLLSVAVSNDL